MQQKYTGSCLHTYCELRLLLLMNAFKCPGYLNTGMPTIRLSRPQATVSLGHPLGNHISKPKSIALIQSMTSA